MKPEKTVLTSLAKVGVITALILLLPLSASLISDEVAWSLVDFIAAGGMLFGTGSGYLLLSRQTSSLLFKAASGLMLITALLLIWTNLAVGIIGSESNTINLLFYLVVLVLIAGTFISRFHPHRMALTLFITATAQSLITLVALYTDMQNAPGSSIMEIILINGGLIALFTLSGILFQVADKEQTGTLSNAPGS
jgi:hypothetical protein